MTERPPRTFGANRLSRSFASGGRLHLTDRDLSYRPHSLEKWIADRTVTIPLAEISTVRVERAPLSDFLLWVHAGHRRHVVVDVDGTLYRFLVWHPDRVAEQLSAAVGGA